ncbi:MAG: hypothetical protein JSU68_06765 [Phycisphaerales bacterium]|nr:MAG: hypothetical protein JSU68_06765 [Phycisphaerales bacterium]
MLCTGIDEAGYGPVLGPLVVAAVTFDIPDRCQKPCLWSLLDRVITPHSRPPRGDARLPVCDSKKLHSGPRRFVQLERTAAAFLGLDGGFPGTFEELLRRLTDAIPTHPPLPPWYGRLNLRLPAEADSAEVRTHTAALAAAMRACGIRLVSIRVVLLTAPEFNHMVTATKNKSAVLFWATMRLAVAAMSLGAEPHTLLIDRQGGRKAYASVLLRSLDIDTLHVLSEDDEASRYTLTHLPHLTEIGFYKSGERQHSLIALASIVAKYVRELSMRTFNGYWRSRIEGLAATAGYYSDGMRFFSQIEPHLRPLGIKRDSVLRIR